ncbi:MAG: glycosyltransferase [Elusimicrobiaceae bacterium]|nr:glycosyltransferase [Elusimicrobiaceae bacterium]
MTIICVSHWLENLVRQSFLKEYNIEVVYNTVDKNIFKPTLSDFRKKHGLENKKIILGVASVWEPRKGLKDFIKLAGMLDDNYHIVLVGLKDEQIKTLPKNCLGIKRTASAQELASIYSAADVFFNPSKEETFGLTTLEALSCGTKAVVYADTACEEIAKIYGGQVVNNVEEFISVLKNQEKEK